MDFPTFFFSHKLTRVGFLAAEQTRGGFLPFNCPAAGIRRHIEHLSELKAEHMQPGGPGR